MLRRATRHRGRGETRGARGFRAGEPSRGLAAEPLLNYGGGFPWRRESGPRARPGSDRLVSFASRLPGAAERVRSRACLARERLGILCGGGRGAAAVDMLRLADSRL